MGSQPQIDLLQAEADEEYESHFRILVDGNTIKYVTIDAGLYPIDDMCFGPSLVALLPELPPGDWNDGLIAKHPQTGDPYFASATRTQFPGVQHQWHKLYIDYQDLVVGKRVRSGIYEVTCPQFNTTVVIAKFARFDWEIQYMENETTAYEWIDGHAIGPRFLGHLTEDGRVIGFLVERITDARHADANDLAVCQQILGRLHELGVWHGDTNRFNFLVRGSQAVLIDFDTARKCDDKDVLRKEFEGLEGCFMDESGRGGGGYLPLSG
jgi:predicted Ser/Thr protein kinase